MKTAVVVVLLALTGCTSTTVLVDEYETNAIATCKSQGFESGTWGLEYCRKRTLYLRVVALGGGSQAGSMALVSIDINRRQCLDRVEASRDDPETIKQMVPNMRAKALPPLIEQYGVEAGIEEFDRSVNGRL